MVTSDLNKTVFGNTQEVIPESMKFSSLKRGAPATRTRIRLRPEQNQYSTQSNQKIQIKIPNDCIIDFRDAHWVFKISIQVTGGSYVRLSQGIQCLFERMRTLSGSTQILEVRNWNDLMSKEIFEKIPPEVLDSVGMSEGYGSQADRNAAGSQVTEYNMCFMDPLLGKQLVPLHKLKGLLQMELYLDNAQKFVETDGTNPIVTLSDLELHCDRVELSQSYLQQVDSFIAANGFTIGFLTWERYDNNLISGGQTQDLRINAKQASVNGIKNYFNASNTVSDTTVNDKFLTWPKLDLFQSQLIINSKTRPDEPVLVQQAQGANAWKIYTNWIGYSRGDGFIRIAPPINEYDFNNSNQFVYIDDFEAYREESDLINPFTTIGNQTDILQKLVFSSNIPANYQRFSWLQYYQKNQIFANGTVNVTY